MAKLNATNYKQLFRRARRQGWKITITPGSHYKLVPPDPTAKICYTACSPSDHRAFQNFLSEMKRSGYKQ